MKSFLSHKKEEPRTYELDDILTSFSSSISHIALPPSSEYLNPNLLKQFSEARPRSASVLSTIETLRGLPLSALVQDGFTILHIAIWRDDVEHAKSLIEMGVDINAKNNKGETPLHLAAFTGNIKIIQFLLQHRANIEAKDLHDQTPLHVAAFLEYTEIVNFLVSQGANIEATSHQQTPLHVAARWGRTEVVYELLDLGANLDAKDRHGWTPLHKSAYYGLSVEVATILVEKGADVMAKNKGGFTAHELAKYEGHKEVAEAIKKEAEKKGKNVEPCYMQ